MAHATRIQVFCDGGFGNRLNTLLSGLAIAKLLGLQATIYWPRNNWCQAAFFDIFSDIFSTPVEVSERSLSQLAGTLNTTTVLLHDQLGADTLKVPFQSAYAYASAEDFSARVLATGQDIFYYPALIPPWLPTELVAHSIQQCHFQERIRQEVIAFVGGTMARPFHGLHLRRTDLNVGFSDQEVQDLLRRHPKEAFFVCSDDPVAEALAAVHPHAHHRPKRAYADKRDTSGEWTALTADDDGRLYHSNIDRSAASVLDAVIDMLILAHSAIVGYSGSTFQNMARLYGEHAPLVMLAKPAQEIDYVSWNHAARMLRAGAMPLGDAIGQGTALYGAGRKSEAIALEKLAIEHASAQGTKDLNVFVLHYNAAAHLLNENCPYEAGLYLEKALEILPDHAETQALLQTARQRTGYTPKAASSRRERIKTYMQWHLGDNLIHLHFLRKLAEKYPELEFQHALNPAYMGQCAEVVQDMPRITLVPLSGDMPEGRDGWKGADGFFFSHPKKFQFAELYLDLFGKLSREMGLSTPFQASKDLLFDYPAILTKQTAGSYDVLLVNSMPLSQQFKSYNENDFITLAGLLRDRGLAVITTQKIDGLPCTQDTQCSVTDIANISLRAKYFIAVCTGAMWPSMNVYNQNLHRFKIILNDHEVVDIGKNVTMCTDSRLLKDMVLNQLDGHQHA